MEPRTTYNEITADFMSYCIEYCKVKVRHQKSWVELEHECFYAYDQYVSGEVGNYCAYDRPIENLMLEIVTLIVSAGRFPDIERQHRDAVVGIIEESGLNEMLGQLQVAERTEFENDLLLLGFDKGLTKG